MSFDGETPIGEKLDKIMKNGMEAMYLQQIKIEIEIRLDHMGELQIFLQKLKDRK